jgi:D-serine deaminase-like pyridoxal phosphate-dependent protein
MTPVNDCNNTKQRRMTPTPALILDLDALESNISLMATKARKWGVSLRPHAKTHKSAEIAQRQMNAGAVGVTCATLGEAELMVRRGIPSVLLSSPVVSDVHIARLLQLLDSTSEVLVVVDNGRNVEALSTAARSARRSLPVLVDYDVGQHRTGCTSIEEACRLATKVAASAALGFRGIQAYAGHVQHIVDVREREETSRAVASSIGELTTSLRRIGLELAIRTGSGSGTADFDGPNGVFTELQVGSYIFMDVEYLNIKWPSEVHNDYISALFVDTTVVSAGWPDHVTTDGGTKAFSQGGPAPELINADARWRYSCDNDEHGCIERCEAQSLPTVGTRLTCIVPHCDPTVSLYREYVCVRLDKVVATWPIEPRA